MILAVAFFTVQLLAGAYHTPVQVHHGEYFPLRDNWERRKPADVGMDAAKLNAAVEFMKSHETTAPARDFSDQEIIFGKLLGSIPAERGATNGLIVRHGYIVAEFGDTGRPDPTYSVAKSMLSTVAGISPDPAPPSKICDPLANTIEDSGDQTPPNSPLTWRESPST